MHQSDELRIESDGAMYVQSGDTSRASSSSNSSSAASLQHTAARDTGFAAQDTEDRQVQALGEVYHTDCQFRGVRGGSKVFIFSRPTPN